MKERKIKFEKASEIYKKTKKASVKKASVKKASVKKANVKKASVKKASNPKIIKNFFSNKTEIEELNHEKIILVKEFNDEINELEKQIDKLRKKMSNELLKKNKKIDKIESKQEEILELVDEQNAPNSLIICNEYLKNPNIPEEIKIDVLDVIYNHILDKTSSQLESEVINCAIKLLQHDKIETGIELLENALYHNNENPELYSWLGKLIYKKESGVKNMKVNKIFLRKILSCFEKAEELLKTKLKNTEDDEIKNKLKDVIIDKNLIKDEIND